MGSLVVPAWSSQRATPLAKTVRILSLNANSWTWLGHDVQPELAAKTMDDLTNHILRANPDILFLQELWHPWWGLGTEMEERFYEKLAHLHFVKERREDRAEGSDLELVIGSRYPLDSKMTFEASLSVEANSPYGKLKLHSRKVGGVSDSPFQLKCHCGVSTTSLSEAHK